MRPRICITTTPQVKNCLVKLVTLGLYGNTIAEVAERLLCEALRNDLKDKRKSLINDPKPKTP
jgi:Ran GTPase-activating protein (RanGAP) involved in mRNA processing and transport